MLVLLALSATLAGCSRGFYRVQADKDARYLVLQKAQDPRWEVPDFNIELDPRSRYFSPYDPDFPPMPPDDPVSHQFMRRVNGMKHFNHWYDHGTLRELENPCWDDYLGQYVELTDDGAVLLDLETAVRLALIHSPDYQEQLETVYLSALDVSTERFRFDVQLFGGNFVGFEHLGSERPGAPPGESNTLTVDSFLRMERQFATAGQLLVEFANSTVWQFFGPDTSFTTSVLSFNLLQPLLRAGGRAIALEQLTIAERGLLANVRAFQRYRRGFYTRVAIGETGVSEPQRRGGFFGGTGLTGFSGQGSGGFGGVGEATGFGRAGFGADAGAGGGGVTTGFVGGGAGQVGGFIGLLQQLQQIRNTEESLNAQLRTLALLEANLEAGLIDIAQVDQFRQSIETERANQLQAVNELETSLDTFKSFTLGLPPDLPVELDDTMIRMFQLITPPISETQNQVATFLNEFGELPVEPTVEQLEQTLARVRELRSDIAEKFTIVLDDLEGLQSASADREAQMTEAERDEFREEIARLRENFDKLRSRFEGTADTLEAIEAGLRPETTVLTANTTVGLLTDLLNIAGELSLIQARARLESIVIEPVELEPEQAIDIARANRLDWMNNRAVLVDSWRLIEFNANALKSRLDIELSGDIQTLGGSNPVNFRDETGRLAASVEFDAPLTRLIERNNFRQQLINYQQARRQLIQFEDGVHRSLRRILRTLTQLETNMEIQRRAVAIAIRRVEQTREVLNKPAPPTIPGQPPAQFGPTAALNLLTALSDLRSSQNNLMSVWLNHRAARLTLLRDLGVMRIDENGLWVDEPLELAMGASELECPVPPAVPTEWWQMAPQIGPTDGSDANSPQQPMPGLFSDETAMFDQHASRRRGPSPMPAAPRSAEVVEPLPAPPAAMREGAHIDDGFSMPVTPER